MADEKVKTETLTLRNRGKPNVTGTRFVYNAKGQQVMLAPGEEAVEVEVLSGNADLLRKDSEAGGDIEVSGAEGVTEDERDPGPTREEIEAAEKANAEAAAKAAPPKRSADAEASASGGKLSRSDLNAMTKAELADRAVEVGAEVTTSMNKDDMVSAIMKAQRG